MFSFVMNSPYRFLIAAAVLAALLCLFPARANVPQEEQTLAQDAEPAPQGEIPAGADLSERTQADCMLHRTLVYAPCGHSVQRREALPAQLCGLTRGALEAEMKSAMPGLRVTAFSGTEVDAAQSLGIPCPLHWVLTAGEDGMLCVMQNLSGEALSLVRSTDVALGQTAQAQRQDLLRGIVFDDVQALEGYLENLSS